MESKDFDGQKITTDEEAGKKQVMQISILEYLTIHLKCEYLSDLRLLRRGKRTALIQALEEIPVERADLYEWNEALNYLTEAPPCESRADAKHQIIKLLEQHCQ